MGHLIKNCSRQPVSSKNLHHGKSISTYHRKETLFPAISLTSSEYSDLQRVINTEENPHLISPSLCPQSQNTIPEIEGKTKAPPDKITDYLPPIPPQEPTIDKEVPSPPDSPALHR